MSEESLISCDLDFDQEGKQFSNLAVPQSTNSAGWAVSYIPIFVVKNGDGPTAVLFGGNHGDEYEGPVTLLNLARQLTPDQITGRIIIVPMLNRPAVVAGTRLSPIDGVNMNRAYPGRRNDSITGMIAHFVSTRILPLADLVVDIHSGGSSMHMVPSVNMHDLGETDQMRRMLDAGRAWGAPYVFIYEDVAGEGLLPSLAERMGKVTLGTEMGSKAQFGVETLKITARGVWNVLHWAEILREPTGDRGVESPAFVAADESSDYIMSPSSGILEPLVELGDEVASGQPVAQLHSLEHPNRAPEPILAANSGIIVSRRSIPLTTQGECTAVTARAFQP